MTRLTRKCDRCPTVFQYDTRGTVPKHCPRCTEEATREYRKQYRERKRLERWGLTAEEYARLVERGCAICGGNQPFGRNWSMDHRHDCVACVGEKGCPSCFRDLLCSKCNSGLGQLDDDTERMERAIEYLRKPPYRALS